MTPAIAASFEQQRDIEHGKRLALGSGATEKPLLRGGDHRMKDLLEPLERIRIPEYPRPEKPSIDPSGCGLNARKGGRDLLDGSTPLRQQPVDDSVGVEYRDSELPHHLRGSAFAHPDRAGKAENNQRDGTKVATTAARSWGVT